MPETRECTLMFYFASDNPLAISIVSQLKAIKAAGHHPQANVIVQFDPFTEGTPTHIFDVNLINKLKSNGKPNIGFDGDDPFVRNLIEDKLWSDELTRNKGVSVREAIKKITPKYDPPKPTAATKGIAISANGTHSEPGPKEGLAGFLRFCRDNYPANHYMLFILGHGVVVGNDVFLFDENASEHSLSLGGLREVLEEFKANIKKEAKFDLIGFHSCSVSSIEVAYELKDTAKYMIASQGTAFVGSWPYRQILLRIFKDLEGPKLDDNAIKRMLVNIFFYCLHNSTDFLLAGYPFDLAMWNLGKVSELKAAIKTLSQALMNGLTDPLGNNLIILAHWKAQSFYKEMYTDLADFCFCLAESIRGVPAPGQPLQDMLNACEVMIEALKRERRTHQGSDPSDSRTRGSVEELANDSIEQKVIVCAEFAGPEYQYARGLSVYFPWSEPSADSGILGKYAEYKLTKDFDPSWLDFLQSYFALTERQPSRREQHKPALKDAEALLEDEFSLVYSRAAGPAGSANALDDGRVKTDPKDATGGDCGCPTIKNYPRDTRDSQKRITEARDDFPVGQAFFGASSS
jgi:Clostripain family